MGEILFMKKKILFKNMEKLIGKVFELVNDILVFILK
jgi:hypothetical protein